MPTQIVGGRLVQRSRPIVDQQPHQFSSIKVPQGTCFLFAPQWHIFGKIVQVAMRNYYGLDFNWTLPLNQYLSTILIAAIIGAGSGYVFWLISENTKLKKFLGAGIIAGLLGWGFGLFLPVREYKWLGTLVYASIFAFDGSFIWWTVSRD